MCRDPPLSAPLSLPTLITPTVKKQTKQEVYSLCTTYSSSGPSKRRYVQAGNTWPMATTGTTPRTATALLVVPIYAKINHWHYRGQPVLLNRHYRGKTALLNRHYSGNLALLNWH